MRYVCVHGHFYQPPRENPWLELIERQPSAAPFHDWNERIQRECYGPNAASRTLDPHGRIASLHNNYSRMSFNFGPTLLSWMARCDSETLGRIRQADRDSARRFDGHGSAMAQAYNHMILPLANARDKKTQVRWGVADFEHHFGRRPEGMWLPEAAVDTATLEALADEGLRFTVLSPSQARRVRPPGGAWRDVSGDRVDPRRAYRAVLPSGRELALFFYDGSASRAIAFEGLLRDGAGLARRLVAGFDGRSGPQLVHVATDGESYGHHHAFGDMALAFALQALERDPTVELTNYGAFLQRHPPTWQAEIFEPSAWSCAHGVGRWERDCGCAIAPHAGTSQAWRGPLRRALDGLRDSLAEVFGHPDLLKDPWQARDDYIDVILGRAERDAWLDEHAARPLDAEERVAALSGLEAQRQAMLMYTSCGWFFDDLAGIEPVQLLCYAARAAELGQQLGFDAEPALEAALALAASNDPAEGDGRTLYRRARSAARMDPPRLAANLELLAVHDLRMDVPCSVGRGACTDERAGPLRLRHARLVVVCQRTGRTAALQATTLAGPGPELVCAVAPDDQDLPLQDVWRALRAGDVEGCRAAVAACGETHDLASLLPDVRARLLAHVLADVVGEVAVALRDLDRLHAPTVDRLARLGVQPPGLLTLAGEAVRRLDLEASLAGRPVDVERVRQLFASGSGRDPSTLGHAMEGAWLDAAAGARWTELADLVELAQDHGAAPDAWRLVNVVVGAMERGQVPASLAERLSGLLNLALSR